MIRRDRATSAQNLAELGLQLRDPDDLIFRAPPKRARVRADGTVSGIVRRAGQLVYLEGIEVVHHDHLDEALDTMVGAPVFVGHPDGMVRDRPWLRELAVGEVVRAWRDGDRIIATKRISCRDTRSRIDSGELTELSPGYQLTVETMPGVAHPVQRIVRYDHVAILRAGHSRCGASCSLRADGKGSCACSSAREKEIDMQHCPRCGHSVLSASEERARADADYRATMRERSENFFAKDEPADRADEQDAVDAAPFDSSFFAADGE